ncbi:hypothetical protein HYY75_11420 [bacterium]|nr:hypothetical protein [bacterium]
MKISIRLFLYVALVSIFLGQKTVSGEPGSDSIVESLRNKIPKGWKISVTKDELSVIKEERCWVLFENRINAPFSQEKPGEREQRIRSQGKEVYAEIKFKMEPRWPPEKIEKVTGENLETFKKIQGLPRQFSIDHLHDSFLSSKGEETFVPKTEKEKKRVEEFKKAKLELEKKIVKLPDFHTQNFSLFVDSHKGLEDEFHIVYPEETSREGYQVLSEIKELCEK